MISILMSVYNASATLEAAVESILNQTYTDFEFIVCDDASADNSLDILNRYAERDSRIRIIRNGTNLGLGASLNRCLAEANGEYIARQDADDISDPTRLEKTLDYLKANSLPYAACGVLIFDDGGVWSKRMFPEVITKHIIAQKNPFFHPTMLFKREVLEQANGYRVVKYTRRTEDYDLVMRLAGKGIIGQNLQEHLYSVYEPQDAYKRHTFKTRWYEIRTRLYGLKQMKSPITDYVYLIKPVIMALMPRPMIKKIKQVQWARAAR